MSPVGKRCSLEDCSVPSHQGLLHKVQPTKPWSVTCTLLILYNCTQCKQTQPNCSSTQICIIWTLWAAWDLESYIPLKYCNAIFKATGTTHTTLSKSLSGSSTSHNKETKKPTKTPKIKHKAQEMLNCYWAIYRCVSKDRSLILGLCAWCTTLLVLYNIKGRFKCPVCYIAEKAHSVLSLTSS